jgi:Ulp1 family protease
MCLFDLNGIFDNFLVTFFCLPLLIMKKVVYPEKDGVNSVEITEACISCLEPGECLNDDVMIFYIFFLRESYEKSICEWIGETSRPTFGFATPFFYTKVNLEHSETSHIERWFEVLNIKGHDYTFIPVHHARLKHWKLLIVDRAQLSIYLLDSLEGLDPLSKEDEMSNFLFHYLILIFFLSSFFLSISSFF